MTNRQAWFLVGLAIGALAAALAALFGALGWDE